MGRQKHLQLRIALISILLLIGQYGVLVHSAEHPFHAQDKLCHVFLQCENTDNGLISQNSHLSDFTPHSLSPTQVVALFLFSSQTAYPIRAPPTFS